MGDGVCVYVEVEWADTRLGPGAGDGRELVESSRGRRG